LIYYLYGAAQAIALATHATGTPFDPCSLNLPSIGALVGFYHASLGFPVKQTWLDTIKASNCNTFEGPTYSNAAKYCPDADETIMGHLAQQHQNVQSTKAKPTLPAPLAVLPPPIETPSNQVIVNTKLLSKLLTNNTGCFPIRARSSNQYIMIAFHANGNLILQKAFKSKSNRHRIASYNTIMTHLVAWGLSVDLQNLDNKASAAYKEAITFKWNATFQLVPPDMHRRNWAERAICMFKDCFLAILASVDSAFPPYLWDLLLLQAKLTLNLLQQATLNPQISAWDFFQWPFDFNKMPLGPVGCCVLIFPLPASCWSWDFHAKNGFYIGPALESYCCFKLVNADTKSQVISNRVKFCHSNLSVPAPSTEDRIVHGLQVVTGALAGAAPPTSISQVDLIANLCNIFESWHLTAPPDFLPMCSPLPGRPSVPPHEPPRVCSPLLPTPDCTWSPVSSWSTPPMPAASALSSPAPIPPRFQATPQRLDFSNVPFPRVVSKPQVPSPRVAIESRHQLALFLLVLPTHKPISHCTHSRMPAPLALFTAGQPLHKWFTYHIITAKFV
jgi:hypothetical protein